MNQYGRDQNCDMGQTCSMCQAPGTCVRKGDAFLPFLVLFLRTPSYQQKKENNDEDDR